MARGMNWSKVASRDRMWRQGAEGLKGKVVISRADREGLKAPGTAARRHREAAASTRRPAADRHQPPAPSPRLRALARRPRARTGKTPGLTRETEGGPNRFALFVLFSLFGGPRP